MWALEFLLSEGSSIATSTWPLNQTALLGKVTDANAAPCPPPLAGPHIFYNCPSGNYYDYRAFAMGARSQVLPVRV